MASIHLKSVHNWYISKISRWLISGYQEEYKDWILLLALAVKRPGWCCRTWVYIWHIVNSELSSWTWPAYGGNWIYLCILELSSVTRCIHIAASMPPQGNNAAIAQKLVDNLQTDLRQLSSECKRKYPPVKEVNGYSMRKLHKQCDKVWYLIMISFRGPYFLHMCICLPLDTLFKLEPLFHFSTPLSNMLGQTERDNRLSGWLPNWYPSISHLVYSKTYSNLKDTQTFCEILRWCQSEVEMIVEISQYLQ